MDIVLARQTFEVARDIEKERWDVPKGLEGKVIPFEEWLLKHFPKDEMFSSPVLGRKYEPKEEYKGAQTYMRLAKFVNQLFKDDPQFFYYVACKCGECERIVLGQPQLIVNPPKIIQGGYPEYACRSCDALMYTLRPSKTIED